MTSFEQFFAREYEPMVRSLTLAIGSRAAAEDAAATGFERAFRRWAHVGGLERPGTWVYVVAVRKARRALADDRKRALGPDQPEPGVEAEVVSAQWIASTLSALTARQRAVVVLRHRGGLRVDEIAEALGISSGTVKSTLHAAYRRLRVELTEQTHLEELADDAY